MNVQRISKKNLAVYYNLEDLKALGIDPNRIDSENAANLAKNAFGNAQIPISGSLDIDVYINTSGMMLFANVIHAVNDVYALYQFDNFENIIGAAHTLLEVCAPPSTLIYYNNSYYLAFHACEDKPSLEQLREFGDTVSKAELRFLYLCEHGKCLFFGDALTAVTTYFHK